MSKAKGPGKKTAGKAAKASPFSLPKAPSLGLIDLEMVRELARIATEFDLSEVSADPSGRMRVRRGVAGAGGFSGGASEPRATAPAALSLMPSLGDAPAEAGPSIMSPFVGTFYASPSPEAAPYVEAGQAVRKGQVVCIVEAMKLMNEIESEIDGKIVEVLVKSGEHVEYGQALFRVAKP